jgi:hypothetical protein
MKLYYTAALTTILLAADSVAFTHTPRSRAFIQTQKSLTGPLHVTTQRSPEYQQKEGDEVERLKFMAQKLRAEAALLEAERAEELAEQAGNFFQKFDSNKDGEVTLNELKAGLEKVLKVELPDSRVRKLMEAFDQNSDGVLQLEEFVTIEIFRNRLEAVAREEKRQATDAKKAAVKEAEMANLVEVRASLINEAAPSNTDKIVSVLPYLLPLLDSVALGRFLLAENQDNPLVIGLGLLYTAYRTIPLSGFIAYLGLNRLSGTPSQNRLVRFNSQQAIFLDIALFFPSLVGLLFGLLGSGAGLNIPPAVTELSSDVLFGTMLLTIAYCSVSSILGIAPNKIPLISKMVEDRMPTIDMFDMEGRFIPEDMREEKNEDKKDK